MKRKWLKITSMVTVAAMLLAGCGSQTASTDSGSSSEEAAESSGGTEAVVTAEPGSITYPLNSDITVSWYAQDNILPHEKFADASESPFHIGLAEKLGVTIDWSFPTTCLLYTSRCV